jgi:phage head maturation protease
MFMPLGRKSVGTLELREDEHGLHTVIHLDPRQSYHRDAWFSVDRGDTQGASFKFDAIRAPFDRSTKMRELIEVRLYEVSPVTFPAYEPTEAIARDLFSAIDSEITTQEPDMHHSEATEPDMHHSDAGVQQTKRNVRNASLLLAEMEARQ